MACYLATQWWLVRVREQLSRQREDILRVAAHHGAGNVFVFSSVARGEETTESDLDLPAT
jgi:predicted nucleotidyltransferase